MKRLAAAAALVAVATTLAWAGPIEDRQAVMKGVAGATKTAVGMAKGETPYDDAKAKQVLQVYVDAAAKMPTLFPPGSDKGETTASPKSGRTWRASRRASTSSARTRTPR